MACRFAGEVFPAQRPVSLALKRHESPMVRSGLQDPWRGNAAAGAIILANGIDWNNEAVDGNDFRGSGICGRMAAVSPASKQDL